MHLVLLNPAAGTRHALPFFNTHVLPLLHANDIHPPQILTTHHPGHAQSLIHPSVSFLLLASGDGTLHEILDSLSARHTPLRIALIPCGTANALYASLFPPGDTKPDEPSYMLQSVASFIAQGPTVPLTLASTTLFGNEERSITSCVVVSTSLHALILRDSEVLRAAYPGIERFKMAAQQNSTKWYNARLRLSSQHQVQIYDPAQRKFVAHPNATPGSSVDLDGPFAYFLSTVNVDRLEPSFRITPLARSDPPLRPLYDIVIVRPLRDPSLPSDDAGARRAYSAKMWQILGAAYADGAHIGQRYTQEGAIADEGDGPNVVEYLRCEKWEWIPDPGDEDAHCVCCDGSIFEISPGGHAVSTIHSDSDKVQIYR